MIASLVIRPERFFIAPAVRFLPTERDRLATHNGLILISGPGLFATATENTAAIRFNPTTAYQSEAYFSESAICEVYITTGNHDEIADYRSLKPQDTVSEDDSSVIH